MQRCCRLFVLCALVCSFACLASAQVAEPSPSAHDSPGEVVEKAILKRTLGAWWGGVLVVKDGKTALARGFGLANEDLAPITADTLFDVGHISQQFTAAAVLRLEQDGKLSIED